MSNVPLYDALAADYDRFVNWDARLAHEMPFLEDLFEVGKVRRTLDAACGSGQHAIALAQRGYQVVGADLSAPMIRRAQENATAAGVDAAFVVAGLGELASLARPEGSRELYDAVLCLGNSLPHLLSAETMTAALVDFAAVLRPGGLLIIQNRNFDRVWTRRERFMGPQAYSEGQGQWLFVRFYDFHASTLTFNMVRLVSTGQGWAQDVESTELRPVFAGELAEGLRSAGFDRIELYGGYDRSPFHPDDSGDLLVVARKGSQAQPATTEADPG
jgi:glycine/sarcosine N-methyltransferase